MTYSKKRSRESRAAIERIYISMRHLITRGAYKPMGLSGQSLVSAMMDLQPEIYGSMADGERVELSGLLYVAERLPIGIEECRIIQLVAREGFEDTGYETIVPLKRRRNCYRIDQHRMYVEMSRGRSDIYDILTHLTFLFIEANKIKKHALDGFENEQDQWKRLEETVQLLDKGEEIDQKKALVYLSNIIGRTVKETQTAVAKFDESKGTRSLYHLVYWLGKMAINESNSDIKREIIFSAELRNVIGHHIYAEQWANTIKKEMIANDWQSRPLHVISANLHSFVNLVYGCAALKEQNFTNIMDLADFTSKNPAAMNKVKKYALNNGLLEIPDTSGTNLGVQFIDLNKVDLKSIPYSLNLPEGQRPLLLVMDYAFGEQAYECMDELLKAYDEKEGDEVKLNIESVSVMGKAGILQGGKGDIMIPTAHVFEGTGDNYPLNNLLTADDFKESGLNTYEGTMITVLGTSLQNKNVLQHFSESTWNSIGLEMEGAHYQKAIQSASKIRKSVNENLQVAYAYYASDNPLATGSTLSSGSLGIEGIKPTYWISIKILDKIFKLNKG